MTKEPQLWQLAEINIARLKYPLEDPRISEFVDNLDPINELAERSNGFVWRLKGAATDTVIREAFDEDLFINISVWQSLESLKNYVFKTDHTQFLRRRKEWFAPMGDLPSVTMWWVPNGHTPTVTEAKERMQHLTDHGPTPFAFSFRPVFEPPN